MKNILILMGLFLFVFLLWYYSLILSPQGIENDELKYLMKNINNWFSIMALVAAMFSLCLVVLKMQTQQNQFDVMMKSNKLNLEIIALSSLIQESDATLHRYDRWEASGIKGDYVNAKSSVRDKMNKHRELLERKFEEVSEKI